MNKAEKTALIQEVAQELKTHKGFYLLNLEGLDAAETIAFRRACYEKGLRVRVVKNTLLLKALEMADIAVRHELTAALKLQTAIIFTSENPKVPAQVLQDFRQKNKKEKPFFKAAYVEESVFLGEEQLEALTRLKTKEELLGELIGRLQAPIQNVVAMLQGAGQTIAGVLKTLSERNS
jgi:large subunit ribosomal protein L10